MDALRSHGHQSAALRLAVSVVRTMKQQQLVAQRRWHESQQQKSCNIQTCDNHRCSGYNSQCSSRLDQPCTSRCTSYSDNHHTRTCSPRCSSGYYDNHSRPPSACSSRCTSNGFNDCHYRFNPTCNNSRCYNMDSHLRMSPSRCGMRCCANVKTCSENRTSLCPNTKFCANSNWTEGWVGHPLDPIGCLFDTLAEASLVPDDQTPRTPSYFGKFFINVSNKLSPLNVVICIKLHLFLTKNV